MEKLYNTHISFFSSRYSSFHACLLQCVTLSLSSCTTSCARYLEIEGPWSWACWSRCGLLSSGYSSSASWSSFCKSLGCCEKTAHAVQNTCLRWRYVLVCWGWNRPRIIVRSSEWNPYQNRMLHSSSFRWYELRSGLVKSRNLL